MATAYCDTCRHFWVTDKTDKMHVGRCHRYPPVHIPAVVMPLKPDEWRYPRVTASDACGEHKSAEASKV